MGRRAAFLERAGALTPRDRMWAAIRQLAQNGQVFSAIEVQFLANMRVEPAQAVHVDSVLTYLKDMSQAQPPYVVLAGENQLRAELKHYALSRDVGVDAPRVTTGGKVVTVGAGYEAVWTSAKVLREFDVEDLHAAALSACSELSLRTVQDYVKFLERAGYLAITVGAVPHRHRARYRFNRSRNTGPRPPTIGTNKDTVIDGNTGAVVWQREKGDEECKAKT